MIEPYRWPCSRLKEKEMAKLVEWRELTGLPITELIRRAVLVADFKKIKNYKED